MGSFRQLLALALCERVAHLLSDEGREAVGVAERLLRGEATEAERRAAFDRAGEAYEDAMAEVNPPVEAARYCGYRVVQVAAEPGVPASWDEDTLAQMAVTVPAVFSWTGAGWGAGASAAHGEAVADLVRCVIGNPFRPVAFLPEWCTPTALGLAERMYDSREFSAMPILADALEDAGCDAEAILTHCRGPGPHARGCWCVEACLGKS